jgi:DNA-binding Lrp family transcriptional regulator
MTLAAIKLREEIIRKLLEGIRRYGLENISTLSKWIGIPVETARYMIWQELPKYDIGVGVSVNFARIGLSRWILEFKPKNKMHTQSVENALKSSGGLMHCSREVPDNSSFVHVATPFGEDRKLRDEFENLRHAGILDYYSFEEIEWMRHLSFDPTFYDFKERKWNFEWADLEKNKEPLLTPFSKNGSLQVDYKDIVILNELREQVPRTLSKLSKRLKLDQHNLRYHYKNHARLAIQGYYLKLIRKDGNRKENTSIKFLYEIENEKSLIEARTVAVSLPFTTLVWKTENTYGWAVRCPGEYVNGLLSYVNKKFTSIQGRLRMLMIDASSEFSGSIPHQLFDDSSGKWNYSPAIALTTARKIQKT